MIEVAEKKRQNDTLNILWQGTAIGGMLLARCEFEGDVIVLCNSCFSYSTGNFVGISQYPRAKTKNTMMIQPKFSSAMLTSSHPYFEFFRSLLSPNRLHHSHLNREATRWFEVNHRS